MDGYRMDRTILTSKDMQMILAGLRDFALKNKNPCSACEFQAKQGISIWGIKLLFFLYNHSKRTPFIV